MGRAAGENHDNQLRHRKPAGEVHLLDRHERRPVLLRRCPRLLLHSLYPKIVVRQTNLPIHGNPWPARTGRFDVLSLLTLWLRESGLRRLHHLHPRQIVQAPAGHVPARHALQAKVPLLQIRRGSTSDRWRRHLHPAPAQRRQEKGQPERQLRIRSDAAGDQPAPRWFDQLDTR